MKETKKTKAAAAGVKAGKPGQKRYVSERRFETNRLKRERRNAKHIARLKARRAAGKRNAYLLGRKGRDHNGLRLVSPAAA